MLERKKERTRLACGVRGPCRQNQSSQMLCTAVAATMPAAAAAAAVDRSHCRCRSCCRCHRRCRRRHCRHCCRCRRALLLKRHPQSIPLCYLLPGKRIDSASDLYRILDKSSVGDKVGRCLCYYLLHLTAAQVWPGVCNASWTRALRATRWAGAPLRLFVSKAVLWLVGEAAEAAG